MYSRKKPLFRGSPVHTYIAGIQTDAMEHLKKKSENAILDTPRDDFVAGVLADYTIRIPELRDSETWVDEEEVTNEVPVRGYNVFTDQHGGTHTVTSHIVSFHVPFDGEGNLFNIEPSSGIVERPAADLKGQELIIKVVTNHKTQEQVRQEYDGQLQIIKQHLSTLTNDLRSLPTQLEARARTYVEQRKAQLLRSKNLVASLGFPMKRRAEAPTTYKAPEVRRKLTPVKSQTVAPFKPEPTLDETEYQHILNVMDNMTRVIELSPHTFRGMGEGDIRQHFLVQLNGQYEGQATGETFNFQAKTDILIRSEGQNIFIAECKFWHGEKGFLETVDQLLSYLSWRDSKTAVVIFNKNKNLSGVLTTIKEAMEKHPHKKRGPKIEFETRFRYIMGNPNDHNREIIMTTMVYDIPIPK
jgi:hypothetical protein